MSTPDYNIAKLIPGRSLDIDAHGRVTRITRKYQILRNDPLTADNIGDVTGLPAMRSAHPTYTRLFAIGYTINEDGNGVRWTVDVAYARSLPVRTDFGGPADSDELARSWSTKDIQVDLVTDALTGKPLLNALGDPFQDVPQVARAMPVFTLRKLVTKGVAAKIALSGTVNSVAITVDGVSVVKHGGRLTVSATKIYTDPEEDDLHEVTYELDIMANPVVVGAAVVDIGWDRAIVQQGFYYKDGGQRSRAMEVDGETNTPRPSVGPVLLAADGSKLASGADPVLIRVATMPEADFADLLA